MTKKIIKNILFFFLILLSKLQWFVVSCGTMLWVYSFTSYIVFLHLLTYLVHKFRYLNLDEITQRKVNYVLTEIYFKLNRCKYLGPYYMLLQNDWQPCMIIWIRSKYWLYEEFCIWMCSWLKSKGQALDIFTWARNPIVGQSALVDYNPGWLEPLVLMMKKSLK